jgi:hypothetical protein
MSLCAARSSQRKNGIVIHGAQHRFRTVKRHSCEISLVRLVRTIEDTQYDYYCAEFRLKNTGDAELRSPVISLRLSGPFYAARPQWDPKLRTDKVSMSDIKGDLFEPNGRMATVAPAPILLRDHSVTFFGLSLRLANRHKGETHPLEYRIDAEGMAPVSGVIQFPFPSEEKNLITVGYLVAEGSAVIDRT